MNTTFNDVRIAALELNKVVVETTIARQEASLAVKEVEIAEATSQLFDLVYGSVDNFLTIMREQRR